jgi:hypothetical protein
MVFSYLNGFNAEKYKKSHTVKDVARRIKRKTSPCFPKRVGCFLQMARINDEIVFFRDGCHWAIIAK